MPIVEKSGLELTGVILLTAMTHALVIRVFFRGTLDVSSNIKFLFVLRSCKWLPSIS